MAVWRIVSTDRKPLCYHLTNLYSEHWIKNQKIFTIGFYFKMESLMITKFMKWCPLKVESILKKLDCQESFYCTNSSDICKSEAFRKWAAFGWEWWPFPVLVPQRSPNYNETARLLIPRWAFGEEKGKESCHRSL